MIAAHHLAHSHCGLPFLPPMPRNATDLSPDSRFNNPREQSSPTIGLVLRNYLSGAVQSRALCDAFGNSNSHNLTLKVSSTVQWGCSERAPTAGKGIMQIPLAAFKRGNSGTRKDGAGAEHRMSRGKRHNVVLLAGTPCRRTTLVWLHPPACALGSRFCAVIENTL